MQGNMIKLCYGAIPTEHNILCTTQQLIRNSLPGSDLMVITLTAMREGHYTSLCTWVSFYYLFLVYLLKLSK